MVKTCPICLESISKTGKIILNCNHHFHINCYTKYVIHETKEISEGMKEVEMKCPMCRASDLNMVMPLLETFEESTDTKLTFMLFVDEIEDVYVKELFPTLATLLNHNRMSKRHLCNVLNKIVIDHQKQLRAIINDVKKN